MSFSTQAAFNVYIYYLALKRHFTSDYDFFKYGGKVTAKFSSFEKRNDKFFFHKLSKMKDHKDLILSNILEDSNIWIGNIFNDECLRRHSEYEKTIQSLTRTFQLDLNVLKENFDENFIIKEGNYPYILDLFNEGKITLQTITILSNETNCLKYWDKSISETIIYPKRSALIRNYRPFLEYDREKIKKIVVDKFS